MCALTAVNVVKESERVKVGCGTNEDDYSWFFQIFSVENMISSLMLLQVVWIPIFREAKKTSSQAITT